MRKGIVGLSPKIMVEILIALVLFIAVFSYIGTGKEKGWGTVNLMNTAMDKGWPLACNNVGVKDFRDFMDSISNVYGNCKTNNKCGNKGCLIMTLDLGPQGIGDGTYNRIGFDELHNYGMDYFNTWLWIWGQASKTRIFCEENDADLMDEIDAYYKNSAYDRSDRGGLANLIGNIFLTSAKTEPERICTRSEHSATKELPLFAVADGSTVTVKATKSDLLVSDTDVRITVDGGQFLILDAAPKPHECTKDADCNDQATPPNAAWGICELSKSPNICNYEYCKLAGSSCKTPAPISCVLNGACTPTTIDCKPPGVFAKTDNGWKVDVIELPESAGKATVVVKLTAGSVNEKFQLKNGENKWFARCSDLTNYVCRMSPIIATNADDRNAKVSVGIRYIKSMGGGKYDVELYVGCY